MKAISILFVLSHATAELVSCGSDPAVGRCLRPLLDAWEAIRESETNARDVLFPVPFYAKDAIHRLCSAYIAAMDNCSQEPTVQKCPNSPLMLFTESYLKFFCGEYGPAYLDNYSCISKSLEASHQCRNYIRGVPNPIQSAGKCRGVSDFFECVEGDLSTECGEISSTLFRRSLEDLGCFEATEESKLILLQTNSTKLLTDQYRRDYFASAPKMEITVVTELPRGVDDYPKMPEIAFDEDTRSNTTVASKGEKTTTTPQVALTDAKVIRSADDGTSESSTQVLTSTEKAEGIQATSAGTVEFLSTGGADGGAESTSAPPELTTVEPEMETTEFVVITTTHPPFCIPYRDHLQITFCHRNFMRKLNELKEESPESTSVRFPLFNVTLETLISICDDLSDTRKCMGGVDKLCIHPLLNFLEQQFYPTCQLLKMRDFDVDYVCIQRILRDREDCTGFVSTKIETTNDKCFGHAEFLSPRKGIYITQEKNSEG